MPKPTKPKKKKSGRTRPKTVIVDAATLTRLRRRWRSWLGPMGTIITDLYVKKEIFWQLQDIAKSNPAILKKGDFFVWMCRNHMSAMAVGVRSFADQHKDVHSLHRLLYEVLQHPGSITRLSHVALYRGTPSGMEMGNLTFDNIVGKRRKHLTKTMIRADLRNLEDATDRVRRFVNKRLAHITSSGEIRRLPKLFELDSALDAIDKIFLKYRLLLTAMYGDTMAPTFQHDWREVLYEPWIPIGSPYRV